MNTTCKSLITANQNILQNISTVYAKEDMANVLWSDSAEELQAGAEEVINPPPLQILVSTLHTQFSQVLKCSVKGIQLKQKMLTRTRPQ